MLYVNHCVKERKLAATIGSLTQTTKNRSIRTKQGAVNHLHINCTSQGKSSQFYYSYNLFYTIL